jgi:hypothetical protein
LGSLNTSIQVPLQQTPLSNPLAEQSFPHAPQLLRSSSRSAQPSLQHAGVVPVQVSSQPVQRWTVPNGWQLPSQQSELPVQASAQPEQLALVPSSVQMPVQHVSSPHPQTALRPLPHTSTAGQQLPATQVPPEQAVPVAAEQMPSAAVSQRKHGSVHSSLQQTPSIQ